jgi:hypothetical protein
MVTRDNERTNEQKIDVICFSWNLAISRLARLHINKELDEFEMPSPRNGPSCLKVGIATMQRFFAWTAESKTISRSETAAKIQQ